MLESATRHAYLEIMRHKAKPPEQKRPKVREAKNDEEENRMRINIINCLSTGCEQTGRFIFSPKSCQITQCAPWTMSKCASECGCECEYKWADVLDIGWELVYVYWNWDWIWIWVWVLGFGQVGFDAFGAMILIDD